MSTKGCSSGSCDNQFQRISRRQFMALTTAAAVGAVCGGVPCTCFGEDNKLPEYTRLINADKKLDPAWIKSLFQRGKSEVYTGWDRLKYIGMPIGGICCGQLYLGGDGKLWYWDIFRSDYQSDYGGMSMGKNYAKPPMQTSPLEQGFAVRFKSRGKTVVRTLDKNGFSDIQFRGEYPVGRVAYRDSKLPVAIDLEAFSPFIPLNAEDSALPGTVLSFTVNNTGKGDLEVDLGGWLENYVCLKQEDPDIGKRRNSIVSNEKRLTLHCTAEKMPEENTKNRPDIVFADFEWDSYRDWTVEGEAFGDKPFSADQLKPHNPVENYKGRQFINTHNSRKFADQFDKPANLSVAADKLTGKLVSKPFKIERQYINFSISGGNHPGRTCVNLLVDGKVVRSKTGHDSNRMRLDTMYVAELEGKTARFEIIDKVQGAWGNIMLDHIVFSDRSTKQTDLKKMPGYGSMALSLIDTESKNNLSPGMSAKGFSAEKFFGSLTSPDKKKTSESNLNERLIGGLSRKLSLKPGEKKKVTFLLTWYFPYYPNVTGEFSVIQGIKNLNRHYGNRFSSASAVADYITSNFDRLAGNTLKWNKVWYDSTLPYWFLDRTFLTIDCLATQTCHWFDNGRFYGWEGVTCCPGTCQYVWNYAQGLARIFP